MVGYIVKIRWIYMGFMQIYGLNVYIYMVLHGFVIYVYEKHQTYDKWSKFFGLHLCHLNLQELIVLFN